MKHLKFVLVMFILSTLVLTSCGIGAKDTPAPTSAPVSVPGQQPRVADANKAPVSVPTSAPSSPVQEYIMFNGVAFDKVCGIAPQTSADAATLFGIDVKYLTEINLKPGDPTKIGWIIGIPPFSEKVSGIKIPAGCTIDYATSSGILHGTSTWRVQYTSADWTRALVTNNATWDGYKATVWFTPGSPDGGGDYKLDEGVLPK